MYSGASDSTLLTEINNKLTAAGITGYTATATGSGFTFTAAASGAVGVAPTATLGGADLALTEATAGVTAVAEVQASTTAEVNGGNTSLTWADATQVANAITGHASYGSLNYTVSVSGGKVVFEAKADGPKTSAQQPTFTQATSTNPTVSEVTAGVTAVTEVAAVTGVAEVNGGNTSLTWADASQVANAITKHTSYDSLNYTVRVSDGKVVFDSKAVGPKTSAQQPTFTQATSTDPTVSEVRGGVNAVAENAVRTVVTTTAGVDDDPTPELTRQGVTGRDAVASTPFTPSIDILTSDAAKAALDNLLTALDGINMQRASYGAAINRLEHTMDNLMQMSSNAAATRGRIQDADYAKESTELARTQIVQQASTAMLTQANQSAQSVLALLKG